MVILTSKKNLIGITNYILENDNNQVASKVLVKSSLDCQAYRNRLDSMVQNGIISEFHKNKLIENAHTGTPKTEYFITDPSIDQSQLNTAEFISFTEGSIEGIPFTDQNTVLQAIDIVGALGRTFQRIIANNLI